MKPSPSHPSFIAPMQALAVEKLPEGDFIYEVKLDGYRALAFKDGKDVRNQPLSARRKLLDNVLKKAPENIRLSKELQGTKDELLRVAQDFGLEGLVAKRLNSLYESGRRTGAWVKVKLTRSQEFVIGGYTLSEGSRKYFGSLLVGYNSSEGLRFAGRVGTGFSEKLLASIDAQLQSKRQTNTGLTAPRNFDG
jgi:bifunctional non-homologous end joining protein LigD